MLDDSDCMSGEPWTEAEVEHLRAHYGIKDTFDLAYDLRRSVYAVRHRARIERIAGRMPARDRAVKVEGRRRWFPRDRAVVTSVMRLRERQSYRDIARALGITTSTVAGIVRDHRARWSP